jgi:hypothetical protein
VRAAAADTAPRLPEERLDCVLDNPSLRAEFRRWARFMLEAAGSGTIVVTVHMKDRQAVSFGLSGETKRRIGDP